MTSDTSFKSRQKPTLRFAAKKVTMRQQDFVEKDMKKARGITTRTRNGADIFDDFDALTALVQNSFSKAVKRAVAENDALGIPSPYSKDGKVSFRQPAKATHTPK